MAVDLVKGLFPYVDRQSESRAFSCNVLKKFKRITNILVKVQAETTKRSTVLLAQVYWYLLFGCTPVFTAPDPGKPSLVVKAFKT